MEDVVSNGAYLAQVLEWAEVGAIKGHLDGLNDTVAKQALILGEYQGVLKGVFPAVSAVQSSLGAWLTVVGIVAAALMGIAIFNITRTNTVGDQISGQSQRIGGVEVRMGALETRIGGVENQLDALPQQVARELRNQQPPPPAPKCC